MDRYTYEDQVIEANLGDRTDLTYDNEALDVLTELFDADNNIPDDILNAGQPIRGSPQLNHQLPDSPPYSGSEAYSPDSNKLLSPSACSEVSSQSSGYNTGHSPDPALTFQPDMNQQQQLHNRLIQQQQQMQHQQQMQQLHEHQLLQQHLHQQALQNGGQMIVPPVMMPRPNNVLPQMVIDNHMRAGDIHPQPFNPEAQFANKKRKFVSESPPLPDAQFLHQQQFQVKQEPVAQPPQALPCEFEPDTNTSVTMDISPSMLNAGSYQPIKWRDFQKSAWCPLISSQGHRVNPQTYRLDGDKGFNFSQIDKAFVCQKKNHFQITGCLGFNDAPQYVMTSEGPKPIEGIYMHFYGVKEEAPNQLIQVDQSQADRSKKKFDPVILHPNQENSWKVTIGRLHFSDTTLNNMRKRGKPNPDQRYFLLVVGIFAHTADKEYPVVQQCSEKLIVRASNPGQFQDSDVEPVKWQPGQTPNSVYHSGKVGINTDTPDEALTVAGNVKVMGTIMQPSDKRVKEDITKTDTKEQLKNIQDISLYNYRYTEQFAAAVGLDDNNTVETGVIAQELEGIIPEAVKTTTDVRLPNGEVIDSLKVVDKNRLFMESLGAVKELVNVTDSLESKITYLERFNQKLKKLKRIGSLRSTASNESNLSRVTSISTVSHVTIHRKRRADRCSMAAITGGEKEKSLEEGQVNGSGGGVCSNRFLQILIFVLIFVMLACVGVIVAMLYFGKSRASEAQEQATDGVMTNGRGDPFRQTTWRPVLADYVGEWLMGDGCVEGEDTCDWNHCSNQCQHLVDPNGPINPKFLGLTDPPFEIMLGTTLPQTDDSVMKYQTGSSSDTRTRKRRQTGPVNPVKVLNIVLNATSSAFQITEDHCIDCDTNRYRYTYGVQVSHSFPATNLDLTIVYADHPTTKPWTRVAMCASPTEPADFYDKKCVSSTATNRDPLWNVTVASPPISPERISSQGVSFEVPVGKALKNLAIFRLTSYQGLSTDELCARDLGERIVEFKVWFVRVCYRNPVHVNTLRSIVNITEAKVDTTTTPTINSEVKPPNFEAGSTNLQFGDKPV